MNPTRSVWQCPVGAGEIEVAAQDIPKETMKNSHRLDTPSVGIPYRAIVLVAVFVGLPYAGWGQDMTYEEANAFMDEAIALLREDPAAGVAFIRERDNVRTSQRITYDFIQKDDLRGRVLGLKKLQGMLLAEIHRVSGTAEEPNLPPFNTSLDMWKTAAEDLEQAKPSAGSLEAEFLELYQSLRGQIARYTASKAQ